MATRKTPARATGKCADKVQRKPSTSTRKDSGAAATKPRQGAPRAETRAALPQAAGLAAPTLRAMPKAQPTPMDAETRYRWIAQAAYLRAERRGFAPGHAIEDWLAAEADFIAVHGSAKG
jgi:hypothetical protein